jgi:hypothetical protein
VSYTGASIQLEFNADRWSDAQAIFDRVVPTRLKRLGDAIIRWIKDNGPKDTTTGVESLIAVVEQSASGYTLSIQSTDPAVAAKLDTGRGAGGFPPPQLIQGWLLRRALGAQGLAPVRAVGRSVGESYHRRRNPRNPVGRVRDAMAELVSPAPGLAADVFRVSRKIAREGTPAPRVFERALEATLVAQEDAISRIAAELAKSFNGGA